MDPNGVYAPEGSYAGFNGCPLNGDWTLHVSDNWGVDDGYIFEWGIYFDPSLYPDNEYYQNTITDAYWSQHPTIVSRSEERRVGKESRSRWSPYHYKKKTIDQHIYVYTDLQ